MLWLGIVLLLLANIVIAFLILARGAGWPPFRETTSDSTTPGEKIYDDKSGIDYDEQIDIDLQEYKDKNHTFIMIKAGEGETRNEIVNMVNLAKSKDIKGGFYWVINSEDETIIEKQVNASVLFEKELKELGLDFGFFFRFEVENVFASNNAEKINDYCKKLEKLECGISIGKDQYDNYKDLDLKNIKKYWIYPKIKDSDFQDDSKVQVWSLESTETFKGYDFTKIKRK